MALTPAQRPRPCTAGAEGPAAAPRSSTSALSFGFFFFFFSFFLFLLCGRRNRKQGRTPSQTGSLRHFGTNLGQPLWTEALHWPQSNSTREEPMLPARRHLSFLACSPAARAAPTRNHCAPPPVIRVLSSFFSFH